MVYEDYNADELKTTIQALLNEHKPKLKGLELTFLYNNKLKLENDLPVLQTDRDIIISMYDRMGEGGY